MLYTAYERAIKNKNQQYAQSPVLQLYALQIGNKLTAPDEFASQKPPRW
jgi:hypothetical protein